ncbi:MAG: response regulator [Polyangiales bacterium]
MVDDEAASAELTAALLRSQGYAVHVLHDGHEALERVASGTVDLLVVDLMMARIDGVEVCSHIRNNLHEPFLPVIITTSLHDRESRIRAKEAGADDLLVKPIDGLELLVRIESLLRARASLGGLERDRERLLAELHGARMELAAHDRMLRVLSDTGEEMRGMLAQQRRELDIARKRWSHVAEVRDHMHRLADTLVELDLCLDRIDGTRTIARVTESGEVVSSASDGRTVRSRVTK